MGVQETDPLSQTSLPPGFRFFPTDEELLIQYLCRKVAGHHSSLQIIAEIDLYKFDPWVLPSKAMFGEKEWYFFSPRDRKYPNGSRPDWVAGSGYWKATGTDKVILTQVGIKKAWVFYVGKAPKGTKTNWIMQEYRLSEPPRETGTSSLDDWVLCRIYQKNSSGAARPQGGGLIAVEHSHGSSSSSSSQFNDVIETLLNITKDLCSIDEFLIHMSASEKSNGLSFLRYCDEGGFKVFWYDLEQLTPVTRTLPSASLGESTRIQDRVTSALISGLSDWSDGILLQFWTPIKTKSGETKLTLSEQPFALGELYEGLCRLKYHYLQQENEEDHGQNGPPARVFKRGLCEECPDIMHYSTQEFPSRDYARECGILGYWAVPLFESDSSQHCLGVVECFSMECDEFMEDELQVLLEAMELGFGLHGPYHLESPLMKSDIVCQWDEVEEALEVVREAHQLPLILVWIPRVNDDPNQKSFSKASNSLCCIMTINYYRGSEISRYGYRCESSIVKSGEGLVGSAYSENRPCFSSDARQLSTTDSPFAHWARSAGLTACFVIPLKLVHPMLDDLFLEMFLPPEDTWTNGNSEAMLKSLLSTVAQEFSNLHVDVGLKQDEEFLAEFSYLGGEKLNLSFFHVKRITKGDTENTCSIESLPNDPNAQETTAEEPVHLVSQNAPATNAEHVNLDELQQYPNAHNTSDSSGEVIATIAEDQITVDVLKPYFGNNIDAAAKDLGVSRSTLKRRCRALGIERWPWHKRHKVRLIQPNPRLQLSQTQKNTKKKKAPHNQFQTKNNAANKETAADSVPSNGDRICQSYDIIGKATYGGDTVMFPLKSNGGIKELHKELNQRFQLQAHKFKIKYKYEDDWILITCDQDLNFGMEMIKSTGEKTINLSICPPSTT